MRRVVAYCRNSTNRQAKDGTIEVQQQAIEDWLKRTEGYTFVGWYLDEGKSGALPFEQRPRAKQLLEDAAAGKFDVLLVYKLDRTARDEDGLIWPTVRAFMRRCDVEIISVTEGWSTADDNSDLQTGLLNIMAALERKSILKRTADGKLKAAREGKWMNGTPPYGYWLDDDAYLIVVEDERQIVCHIFDLFIDERLSLHRVAQRLNKEGILSPYVKRGKRPDCSGNWTPSLIKSILTRRMYVGEAFFHPKGHEPVPTRVPAIIDEARWLKAQGLLRSIPKAKIRHMLSGLLRCGVCGQGCSTCSGGYTYRPLRYYQCNRSINSAYKAQSTRCLPYIRAEELEEWVWAQVVRIVTNPGEALDSLLEQEEETAQRIEALTVQLLEIDNALAELATQKGRAATAYTEGAFDLEEFNAQKERITAEIERQRAEKAKAQAEYEQLVHREERQAEAEAILEAVRDEIETNPDLDRNRIVRGLVDSIVAHPSADKKSVRFEAHFVVGSKEGCTTEKCGTVQSVSA